MNQTAPLDELIVACCAGDDAAWREFLARYGDLLYSVALRTGVSPTDAEEVFQGCVLAVYTNLHTLRAPEKLVPWLAHLARRQTLYYLRKRRFEVPRDPLAPGADGLADPDPLPGELLEALQRGQWLREGLRQLRPRCQNLLHALYLDDPPLGYQEIVARWGIPLGSIGPTRARCLQALREALEENRDDR